MVILCVVGDKRYRYLSEKLCELGDVFTLGEGGRGTVGLSSIDDIPCPVDVLVLPMMGHGTSVVCGGNVYPLAELAEKVRPDGVVFAGRIGAEQSAVFEVKGIEVIDYFKSESLALKNSVPTAEGALAIAINETDDILFGSKVLITGWGRTAKCCARLFSAAGAYCTIAARRKEALADAWTEGFGTVKIDEMKNAAERSDIIINTVPALVLTREILSSVEKSCLVIDLASMPGGTDHEAAQNLGIKTVHALALPGKTAPKAAGRIIFETIKEILEERGETGDKGDKT